MIRLLERAYRALLWLYPPAHRDEVGDDMADCFADLLASARRRGSVAVASVTLRTLVELPVSVVRAHLDALQRGGGSMESLVQDVRFAVRGLAKSPGFAALAVVSLGLGVGANTAMFSMIHSTLWVDLPVEEPDELVHVSEVRDESSSLAFGNYVDLAEGVDVFDGVIAHRMDSWGLVSGELSALVHGELVTENYFEVLGIEPQLGRYFDEAQHGAGTSAPVVVLSHYLWTNSFGADPGVVGRVVELNEHPFTVIGVAPEDFQGAKFGISMDLWVPVHQWAIADGWRADWDQVRGGRSWLALARLADGVTLEGANAALGTFSPRLQEAYPELNSGMTFRATDDIMGQISPDQAGIPSLIGLLAVFGSGLVLLVACGNVASLLLARAVARRQEIGMRVALGAGRGRLLRQLMTESIVLAALGGIVGAGLAGWASRFDAHLLPQIPYRFSLSTAPDMATLLFATGASLLAVIVFGLAPALQASRPGIAGVLRGDHDAGGLRVSGSRLLNGVVVGMVSLSFVTLFLAGLFAASLKHVRTIDPGFAREGRLIATMDLSLAGYSVQETPAFFDALEREVAAIPGVTGVAMGGSVPLGDFSSSTRLFADDREYGPDELGANVWSSAAEPEWFGVSDLQLSAGRNFTEADDADAPRVAVVNEALARTFWPDEDPVGRRLRFEREPGGTTIEIVGVVETARYMSLVEQPRPAIYYPLAQSMRTRAIIMVSTDLDPALMVAPVREAARRVDASVPLYDVKTSEQYMANAYWLFRIGAELGLAIGMLAAALAAGGLYGIMAFRVGQRRREMGIRVALGAGRGRVLRHILSGSSRLVGIGVLIGSALAFAVSGVMQSIVFGVEPTSPGMFGTVAVGLTVLALLATLGPALGATRTNPVEAIKTE